MKLNDKCRLLKETIASDWFQRCQPNTKALMLALETKEILSRNNSIYIKQMHGLMLDSQVLEKMRRHYRLVN